MGNSFEDKYIIYITINKINRKIYIGVHKTDTPYVFDGYLGCGVHINKPSSYNKGKYPFHQAILKYGVNSFIRSTLEVFDSLEQALEREAQIVNENFIKRTDTYNVALGGGAFPSNKKTVYQFDTKGNLIKEWQSETEIKKFYDCCIQLNDIINNKRSFAGSFWSFNNIIDIKEYIKEANRGFISQYNKEGILLNTYKNTTIAAQKLDLDRNAITRAVFKKRLYAGCYFLKADVDIAEVLSSKYKPMLGKRRTYQYLKTGELNNEFETITQATKETRKASYNGISKAIINGNLHAGFLWSHIKCDNYFNIDNPKQKPLIKIVQYKKNGNLVKVWDSLKDCKKEFPYALQVCAGKIKSTAGYIFKYLQN